jgi:hypothetical protein
MNKIFENYQFRIRTARSTWKFLLKNQQELNQTNFIRNFKRFALIGATKSKKESRIPGSGAAIGFIKAIESLGKKSQYLKKFI